MDACILLERSSCTLDRVLGCLEIDVGVARAHFSSVLHFDFSCATLFDRISQIENR